MKKFAALLTDSYKELKVVRNLAILAMFAAIAIILGFFSIDIGPYIRIGFSSVVNGMVACLFGPVTGGIFNATLDVFKYILKPVGTFFPPMTAVTVVSGLLYGFFYYKKEITLVRVFTAKFVVMLICNVILNTWCLSILYGDGFLVLLPGRVIKNVIMWPIDSIVFYMITKSLEKVGVFRLIRQ